MVVQCPQCETGHLLGEDEFGGRTQLEVQCTKCQTAFVVKASPNLPTGVTETSARPARGETITVLGVRTKLPEGKHVALVVMQGAMAGEVFRLAKPEVIIGRVGTDIVVDDPEVSATHCALEVRGSYGVLTDLGSTNGTFVGEEQIKSFRLEHLADFRIGATTLMFTVTDLE